MRKQMLKFLPLCLMAALLSYGCVQTGGTEDAAKAPAKKAEQAQKENVYKGKVTGKSNKAKSISTVVGKGDKAKTMMVKFDGKTKGLDHAAKGEAVIMCSFSILTLLSSIFILSRHFHGISRNTTESILRIKMMENRAIAVFFQIEPEWD